MKRRWTHDELIDQWSLQPAELALVSSARTPNNQLGFALLFKWFQAEGQFPRRKQDVPAPVVDFLARQLAVAPALFKSYPWQGRTVERHRAQIRQHLGFREATVQDGEALTAWLLETVLPQQRQLEVLTRALSDRCREQRLEPPAPERMERLIRSALHTADERFFTATLARLPLTTGPRLDALLQTTRAADDPAGERLGRSPLHELKQGAGAIKVESLLSELDKLQQIEELALPADLFADTAPKVLENYRQRVAVEDLHEIQRHPDPVRYTLLAAFCWQRRRELIDTLVDLLIDLIHRLGIRAEHKVDKAVLREIKRVQGKNRLLYEMAEAAVDQPDGAVKDVIYRLLRPAGPHQNAQRLWATLSAHGASYP